MPDLNGRTELHDRPMGELVKQLSDQTTALVRAEVELAKAELSEKGKKAGMGAGMFGGAGLFGVFGFAALTTAFIAALDLAMATWLAALIVAVVYFAIAGIAALMGKKKVEQATPLAPQQAIDTTKADVEVAKARVKEARS
jgi:uncharacterized membrane protein YqjE